MSGVLDLLVTSNNIAREYYPEFYGTTYMYVSGTHIGYYHLVCLLQGVS